MRSNTAEKGFRQQAVSRRVSRERPRRELRTRRPAVSTARRVRFSGKFYVACFFFLLLVGKLLIRIEILDTGYQLEAVRKEALKKDAMLRERRMMLAFVSSPQRIKEVATKELGMVRLTPQRIRKVERE